MNNIKSKINCFECPKKNTCLKYLTDTEIEDIQKNLVQIKFKKGEIISKQSSFITHIMYIREGIAKVYKETNSQNNLILDITPHDNLIGLTSLFNDNIAQFTVTALQDTFICAFDKKLIENIVLENKLFSKKIINLLNSESRLFFDKVVSLTQKQMNGRVADALICLSERIFNSLCFDMILSRKDLAEYTGMSTMSIVRTIQKLKKEGIINDEKGKTEILKMDVLKQISKNG